MPLQIHKLADAPTPEEKFALGARTIHCIRAVATGEKRPPKKGEWFLSGAIVEAYKARNDMTTPYQIAELMTECICGKGVGRS